MNRRQRPTFQLESLESRTLLAGDASAIAATSSVITNLTADFTGSEVTIATRDGGELVIDAALLPSSVTELKLSGFSRVTVNGSEALRSLDLISIGSFSGQSVDVLGNLNVHDVATLQIHSIGGTAWLRGTEMRLEVVDARSALITSALDKLTVASSNSLVLLSANPNQEFRLEFATDPIVLQAGSEKVTLPGTPNPGTDPTDNPTPPAKPSDGQSSYVVIIVSLTGNQAGAALLSKLQAAVKDGDQAAVKSAFAEYLATIDLPQSTYAMSFSATEPVEIPMGRVTEMLHGDTAEPHLRATSFTTAAGSAPLPAVTANELHVQSADRIAEAGRVDQAGVAPVAETPAIVILAKASHPGGHELNGRGAGNTEPTLMQEVRSTLSSLIPRADGAATTVSAYIISSVGTDLEPGTLPGLLVDAKGSRARRDVDWVQL